MVDENDAVTTGLLTGVRYVKDNRLLPRGFDKATHEWDIAVYGAAADDWDFTGGSDLVRYAVDVTDANGPFPAENSSNESDTVNAEPQDDENTRSGNTSRQPFGSRGYSR